MKATVTSLDDLRREIDAVDDQLHDLLMRRGEIVDRIAAAKLAGSGAGGTPAMRPAREAAILRRIVARHRGNLPVRSVVRVWREIIAAHLRAQADYTIHVAGGENAMQFWDLARAHFGSIAPMTRHHTPSQVVHACADEPDAVGIVALPESDENAPGWWAQLAPAGHPGPRVVARLPFVRADRGAEAGIEALAIAAIEQEPTGDDTTLVVVETQDELSRARLQSFLKDTGFAAQVIAVGRETPKVRQLLIEVRGFVGRDDARLSALAEKGGGLVVRVAPVGGYANPVELKAGR